MNIFPGKPQIAKKINLDTENMIFARDHWPVVHSSQLQNYISNFYGTDNETDFFHNKSILPQDWIYRTKEITYKFNSLGLRMDKELEDIKDDFIITFGCSHTLGVGVALEDTWPFLLSSLNNLDYINCAVSGSSCKLVAINFFNYFKNQTKKPKAVFIAWPSSIRYCFYIQDRFVFYLPRFISKKSEYKNYSLSYENLITTDFTVTESEIYRDMIITFCKNLGIKYGECSFDVEDELSKKNNIKTFGKYAEENINDFHARDIRYYENKDIFSHIGTRHHREAAEYFCTLLNEY